MTNTLKTQLNKLTLEQLFIIAQEIDNSFWTYEDLKELAIDKIKDNNIFLATHILNALINDLKLDYALLNAFKNYKVTRGNFALKINNYCYLKKLTKNNLKYTFNTNDYKIYKTLEEATTDQNYIKKYYSLSCEVISL